ncbi:MAG: sugar transferase [Coriobacteriia bacterium]|nr:sugar transferase [Coriobacteriia bacterium]
MLSRTRFIAISVLLDAIFVNTGVVLAFLVRFEGALPTFNFDAYLVIAPFATLIYVASTWVYGLYDPERVETAWAVVRSVTAAVTLGTVLVAAVAFFGGPRTASFARSTILLGWVFGIVLLVGWRLVFLRFGRVRWPEQRVVLVGTGPVSVELADELTRRATWGWRVCGLVDTCATAGAEPAGEVGGYPILGAAADVATIARAQNANRVIVVSPVALRELVESLVLADELKVRVDVVPELYEIFIGRVDALIGDIPLMKITESSVPRYYRAAKRAMDLVGAAVVLVLVSPVLLIAAAAIVLSDGFPIIFAQERTGHGLKPFSVYKLRTMVKDAEKLSGPVLAEEDDPRITRVGRFLRKFRIDELPQLANILKGEMSFVGPRPERPFFVEQHLKEIPGYRERFQVKPGVTGLAQVSGGYATTPERKLKYDLIYMYHRNLAMDAQIVAETLKVVLTGHGAR